MGSAAAAKFGRQATLESQSYGAIARELGWTSPQSARGAIVGQYGRDGVAVEPVKPRTHCRDGHLLEDSGKLHPGGWIVCRECDRQRAQARRDRLANAAPAV